MKNLLQMILNLTNVYQSGTNEQLLLEKEKLRKEYLRLAEEWGENQMIERVSAQFSESFFDQIYILSILLENCSTAELLLKIFNILISNKMSIWDLMIFKEQLSVHLHRVRDYGYRLEIFKKRTILNQLILTGYKKELGMDCEYIPFAKRNKTMVIVANQLLSIKHAPTKVLFEICRSVKNLGIQPFIVVAIGNIDIQRVNELWFDGMVWNYSEGLMGDFVLEYMNEKYAGYQLFVNKENLQEQRSLVKQIYDLKPLCIWQIGEGTPFSEIFHNELTVAGMACSSDFIPMEADIMLRYLKETDEETRQKEEYVYRRNQSIIDFRFPCVPQEIKCSNDMVPAIEKDAFLISIVGTRLDKEVTAEFIEILYQILDIDERISFLFIGNFNEYESKCTGRLKERSQYIGKVNDLLTAVGYSKLFLNPPRKGGGAGGMRAILNGIPVITLPGCDIASAVGDKFVCNNYEEMKVLVERYVHDQTFYEEMCEVARKMAQEEGSHSLDDEIKGVVDSMIAQIEKSEKRASVINEI